MKIYTLRALIITACLLAVGQNATAQSIIAHWTFDDVYDADADTTLTDNTGNVDATWLNPNTTPDYQAGILGGAVNFGGGAGPLENNYFQTGQFTQFATAVTNGGYAISAWINPDSVGVDGVVTTRNLDAGSGANGFYGISVYNDSDPEGAGVDGRSLGSSSQTEGGTIDPDDSVGTLDGWYHVVYSASNGGFDFNDSSQVYINGQLSFDGNGGTILVAALTGGNWDIGNDNAQPNQRIFDGLIDDIAIFDGQVDQAKVTELFEDATLNRTAADGTTVYPAPGVGTTFADIRANYFTEVSSRAAGDLDYNGFVDSSDWRLFKDNQGTLSAGVSGAVPEPNSLLLAMVALSGCGGFRFRRRLS